MYALWFGILVEIKSRLLIYVSSSLMSVYLLFNRIMIHIVHVGAWDYRTVLEMHSSFLFLQLWFALFYIQMMPGFNAFLRLFWVLFIVPRTYISRIYRLETRLFWLENVWNLVLIFLLYCRIFEKCQELKFFLHMFITSLPWSYLGLRIHKL